jgi:hypothetical protein
MNYSLFIMLNEGDDDDGGEGATGSDSGIVSPPILVACRSVLSILYSLFFVATSQNSQGAIYIYKSVLGQDASVEAKKVGKGPTWWKLGPTKRPGSGTMQWVLFPPSWCSSLLLLKIFVSLKKLCDNKIRSILRPDGL